MIRIEAGVTVNRPVAEVFRFLQDNRNALQWQSGLLEARVTNDVIGVGRAWVDVVQFLGRRIEVASELVEYEPDRALGFKSTSGPIPLEGRYSLEPDGDGTKLTFTMQGEPGGFFKLAEPIVGSVHTAAMGDQPGQPEGSVGRYGSGLSRTNPTQ